MAVVPFNVDLGILFAAIYADIASVRVARGYAPLCTGALLIGQEQLRREHAPPRIVIVPKGIRFEPALRMGTQPAGGRVGQDYQRPLWSQWLQFEAHCWGDPNPLQSSPPVLSDQWYAFASSIELVRELYGALYRNVGGAPACKLRDADFNQPSNDSQLGKLIVAPFEIWSSLADEPMYPVPYSAVGVPGSSVQIDVNVDLLSSTGDGSSTYVGEFVAMPPTFPTPNPPLPPVPPPGAGIVIPGTAAWTQAAQILAGAGQGGLTIQGSAALSQASVAAAMTGGYANSTPPVLPIAALWRSDSGVTQSGGVVSNWFDQSGAGINLVAAGAAQPTYNASDAGYNAAPTLSFNGTSEYLTAANPLTAQPVTIYLVCESSGTANPIAYSDTNGGPELYLGSSGTIWTITAGSALTSSSGTHTKMVSAAVFNGASSSLYINTSVATVASGNAGSKSPGSTIYVGAFVGPSNFFLGKIAAILLYEGAHTQSQISQTFTYLANIYSPGAWS